MKHFLLACFIPMTLAAQNMQQLTEQLGKTVLYGDVALSPDGKWALDIVASSPEQLLLLPTGPGEPSRLDRGTTQNYYIDDTWRIHPKVTVSIGLRYENVPPYYDKSSEVCQLQ